MIHPLTNVLNKVFAFGFYRAHAGMLLFAFLVMFGAVPGDQLLGYHKALMLAYLTSPLLMVAVFVVWILYSLKALHYTAGLLAQPHQQFIYYSVGAYEPRAQLLSWLSVQFNILLPIILYGGLTIAIGLANGLIIAPSIIVVFLFALMFGGAWLSRRLSIQLPDGKRQLALLRWSADMPKPYFSLYIYHVFHSKKLPYLIVKLISWAVITAVFALFDDVKHDARVAGIAVMAIAVAHAVLIFEERKFEETYLVFSRNLPYSRIRLFGGFALVYLFLLLPEVIWLFARFNPLFAIQLLAFTMSVILLLHSLLYKLGLDMEKYMQWVLGLFMIIFWVMMFKAMILAIVLDMVVAWLLFYYNYYRTFAVLPKKS